MKLSVWMRFDVPTSIPFISLAAAAALEVGQTPILSKSALHKAGGLLFWRTKRSDNLSFHRRALGRPRRLQVPFEARRQEMTASGRVSIVLLLLQQPCPLERYLSPYACTSSTRFSDGSFLMAFPLFSSASRIS